MNMKVRTKGLSRRNRFGIRPFMMKSKKKLNKINFGEKDK
jgi:hypothetical protein